MGLSKKAYSLYLGNRQVGLNLDESHENPRHLYDWQRELAKKNELLKKKGGTLD